MNTFEQIVRELALSDPKQLVSGQYGIMDAACRYCGASKFHPREMPHEHKSDCLWLRARQAVDANTYYCP